MSIYGVFVEGYVEQEVYAGGKLYVSGQLTIYRARVWGMMGEGKGICTLHIDLGRRNVA